MPSNNKKRKSSKGIEPLENPLSALSTGLSTEGECPQGTEPSVVDEKVLHNDVSILRNKKDKEYTRSMETRLRISESHRKRGTKPACGIKKGQTGPAHPAYKHGQGYNRDVDHDKQYAWRQGVMKQAGFKCFITNETDIGKMQCHHLEAWCRCPEGRYDVKNGVLVSTQIHKQFHAEYGNDVGRVEFERFLRENKYWGDQLFPWEQGNHEPSLSVESLVQGQQSYRIPYLRKEREII